MVGNGDDFTIGFNEYKTPKTIDFSAFYSNQSIEDKIRGLKVGKSPRLSLYLMRHRLDAQ